MLSIYNYTEFHKFLRDAWEAKRAKNPQFSMTAFAKKLGLENSAPLSLALRGKRGLPKKYLPQVIQSLELSNDEATYLEALSDLSTAKTPEQKVLYLERLKKLSPQKYLGGDTVDAFKYLSNPLHATLLEMIDLKDFSKDPYWIQEKLAFHYSLFDITDAFNRLRELKLIAVDEQTKTIAKTFRHLKTPDDVADLSTQKFHQHTSEWASKAVVRQPVEDREFHGFSFNMKKKDVKKAKEKIRKFLDAFIEEFEAPQGEGDQNYQLNIQFFRMTK